MNDSRAFQAKPFKRGNHGRVAASHMNQRGKIEVRRQLQLRIEQYLLTFTVQGFDKVIQTDLTHRAQLPMTRQPGQPITQFV